MERENDPMFNEIINACANKRIKKLMGFRNDWNKEIVAQFYATVYFGYIDGERAMFWMTEGTFIGSLIHGLPVFLALDRMMQTVQNSISSHLFLLRK